MSRRTTALNAETGKTYAVTKAMKASEASAIPKTPAPQTPLQKLKRAWVG